ncbi:putative nuclease HARBI1 [Bactrocera neohumeralis]|uniref:putative nuclease HARBI1 n=1 Tax=Bactrocera neohumeralis TaxID=98809 RepID=UPI0021658824|nr:putative nuclease HARBI1 [Bactrocera neohumeralis]
MLNVLERTQCPKWVKFGRTHYEVRQSNLHFYNKFAIPGVIGCIDGTHIKLLKPCDNEHLYLNRKGCFSVNAMIVCDYKMSITAVDACHPGSSHDAFIFNLSNIKQSLLSSFQSGDHSSWLLGDSGYALEPYLLTPYRNPTSGTSQHKFNLQHAKARNIVERVIGVLKSRFKCLQTVLPYTPQKVVKIINVCCAFHNICRFYNVDDSMYAFSEEVIDDDPAENNSSLETTATNIRDQIANNLMQTLSIS